MRRDMQLLCCTDYMLEHRERNRGRHHKTKKKTDMNSASLSKKITVYAIACMAVTALGLGLVFMSLMQADFDSFSNTVLIACAALIIGCGLGVYCWRLLYLARRHGVSRRAHVAGLTAALMPFEIALLAL